MKLFAAGLVVGALVVTVVTHVIHGGASVFPAPDTQTGRVATLGTSRERAECPASADTPKPVPVTAPSPAIESAGGVKLSDTASSAARACAALSDAEYSEILWRRAHRREEREQATRDAEPKDASWSYAIEDQIRQYVGTRVDGGPYENLKVDCRTTFCELKAKGMEREDAERLKQLARTLDRQPWAGTLLAGESGNGGDGGKWTAYFRFRRLTDEEQKSLAWIKQRPPP